MSANLLILHKRNQQPIILLQEMYKSYAPFRFSIDNKEAALIIRSKKVVDLYTQDATPEEKELLNQTEKEAQLARSWVLNINQQNELENKSSFLAHSGPELYLLHKIQYKFLQQYPTLLSVKPTTKQLREQLNNLNDCIQMTILAISEALGFGG